MNFSAFSNTGSLRDLLLVNGASERGGMCARALLVMFIRLLNIVGMR